MGVGKRNRKQETLTRFEDPRNFALQMRQMADALQNLRADHRVKPAIRKQPTLIGRNQQIDARTGDNIDSEVFNRPRQPWPLELLSTALIQNGPRNCGNRGRKT